MSQAMRRPEVGERMSQAMRRQWQNQEFRQRMSQIRQKQWQNPEFRQRMTEAQRRRREKAVKAIESQAFLLINNK
jgi:hypothetical protein